MCTDICSALRDRGRYKRLVAPLIVDAIIPAFTKTPCLHFFQYAIDEVVATFIRKCFKQDNGVSSCLTNGHGAEFFGVSLGGMKVDSPPRRPHLPRTARIDRRRMPASNSIAPLTKAYSRLAPLISMHREAKAVTSDSRCLM